MILCIEEAHRMKWIHRDIKPDNFLISASGHLKISDFGLAFNGHWAHSQSYYNGQRETLLEKIGIKITGDEQDVAEELECPEDLPNGRYSPPKQRPRYDADESARREGLLNWRNRTERRKLARSVVGTSQYMAPEVILGHPYDGRCDWWSVGIILYECLYGRTPFYCENRQKTKEAIVQHKANLHFSSKDRWSRPSSESRRWLPPPSETAVDLIRDLLTDKELRLSSRQYRQPERGLMRRLSSSASNSSPLARHVYANGAEEIKAHKFFHGVAWSQLHLMQPPFVPRVKENQSITKYFEDEKDIISDLESSEYSLQEPVDQHDDEEQIAAALGPKFDAWKAKQVRQEKQELGIEDCSDDELQRIKEHFGPEYEKWKAERIVEVAEKRVELDVPPPTPERPAKKEKKRPRDKMLRDLAVGRQVMDLRKKGAFFGYTYRRPKALVLEHEKDREERYGYGRKSTARPTILPVEDSGVDCF